MLSGFRSSRSESPSLITTFEDLRWLRRLLAYAANEKHIRFGLGGFHFAFSPSSISLTVPISSELLGWWSIDEGSREEQARIYHEGASGYNTFCGYPPEIVKKMPRKELAEEVWRLQAALGEQTEITKFSQQEYERLQNVKVLTLNE
ncbi:hypothetical protein VNO80_19620 [Phaseolus coccineus]|uniref:Uncharacterized protein n=1 Tax=Phaseolus coccineus TaxID=3886 RepID=A0AAN9MGS3_PHACN